MKFVRLHPKEVKYCSTLDWDELMIYLKTKYGIKFQKQFEKQLSEKIINTLKNLSVNDVTDPIKITNGFMILKINNIREKKIENDQEKLLQELIISETNRKYNQFSIIYYNKLKLNTEISE